MFGGIVEGIGRVTGLRTGAHATRLEIDLGELLEGLKLGASVAVNGVCLTLAEARDGVAGFDVIPETLRLTSLGRLQIGDGVNLERSLRVGDRIDGHFVQGHVDGVGVVQRIARDAGEYMLWIETGLPLLPFIVRKGSITLDGVSLTIVDVTERRFSVALIPTTLEQTTLGKRRAGDLINIETDILARLVISRLDAYQSSNNGPGRGASHDDGGITLEALRAGGYVK